MGNTVSKYNQDTPKLVAWMGRSGLTDEQIAAELGINRVTLYRWKAKYPELKQALTVSKNLVDSLVEDSLLKRAMGYDYEETELVAGQNGKTQRIKKVKKHAASDTTACIFWLKNRQPAAWRDKREMEHSGNIGTEQDMGQLTTEELRELIQNEADNSGAQE